LSALKKCVPRTVFFRSGQNHENIIQCYRILGADSITTLKLLKAIMFLQQIVQCHTDRQTDTHTHTHTHIPHFYLKLNHVPAECHFPQHYRIFKCVEI
jgi:hypothetical protein